MIQFDLRWPIPEKDGYRGINFIGGEAEDGSGMFRCVRKEGKKIIFSFAIEIEKRQCLELAHALLATAKNGRTENGY
jgi:hypothetical protein